MTNEGGATDPIEPVFQQITPTKLKQKVAVVGGGCAGLVTTYLLENDYDVVLYEKGERVGGHADTYDVKKDGAIIARVDAGADFLPSERFYKEFFRLLDVLGVGLNEQRASMTFFEKNRPRGLVVLPLPFLTGRFFEGWDDIFKSIAFFRTLLAGKELLDRDDKTTSLAQMLGRLKFASPTVKESFLLPLLTGIIPGPRKEQIKSSLASFIFSFVSEFLTRPLSATTLHCVGGLQGYVRVILDQLKSATIKVNTAIDKLQHLQDGRWQVTDQLGHSDTFDYLVIATEGNYAKQLLEDVPAAANHANAIADLQYYRTQIAVHSDESFMPPHRSDWSTINVYPEGDEVVTTSFRKWEYSRPETPVFKTWTTYSSRLPDSSKLYKVFEYMHPVTNQEYFQAQEKLKPVQGTANLWLAGLYTTGFASHNSAVVSAMNVAKVLAPNAPRLRQLLERPKNLHRGMGWCAS